MCGAACVSNRPETRFMLGSKHGQKLEPFWRAVFGYGTDSLTDIEGGYLCRVQSFDAIRTRMAEAAERACRGGVSAIQLGYADV